MYKSGRKTSINHHHHHRLQFTVTVRNDYQLAQSSFILGDNLKAYIRCTQQWDTNTGPTETVSHSYTHDAAVVLSLRYSDFGNSDLIHSNLTPGPDKPHFWCMERGRRRNKYSEIGRNRTGNESSELTTVCQFLEGGSCPRISGYNSARFAFSFWIFWPEMISSRRDLILFLWEDFVAEWRLIFS